MTIITCNTTNTAHLDKVRSEMLVMGAPTVRAVYDGEAYWAIEGSHRLVAAYELGIEPEIDEVEYNDDLITVQVDGYDEEVIASEWIDMLMANQKNHVLEF